MSKLTNGWGIMVANVGSLHRHGVSAVLLIIVLAKFFLGGVTGLSLDQFYPYNTDTDNKTAKKDDGGSPLLNLNTPFPFFQNSQFQIYVNNNGIISFREKLNSYKPYNFDTADFFLNNNNPALVAPFWSDTDIEHVTTDSYNASVLYRVTNSTDVIQRASGDVNEYFQTSFVPEEVVIVTWLDVGYYGASGSGKNKRNTFQAVLITDGVESYVIFNYNKTEWTTGANSAGDPTTGLGGEPAVFGLVRNFVVGEEVGFYSGNSSRYYLVPSSGTDEVINIVNQSNIGEPGKFIFRVDGETVEDRICRDTETLELDPNIIPMLGRRPLTIRGPCLLPGRPVKARIREENLEFVCQMIETNQAVCVTPPIFRTGEVTLEYDPDGQNNWRYPTVLYVDHISNPGSPQVLVREDIDEWQPGNMVTARWDPSEISATAEQGKTLQVLAYYFNNSEAAFTHIQSVNVEGGVSSRKFKLVSDFGIYSTLIARLCWSSEVHPNTLPVCIWSDVFPVRWKSMNSPESEEWCQNWLNREVALPRITITQQSCPCILTIAENDSGQFQVDPYCDNKQSANLTCVYNSNAKKCFRRNLRSSTFKGETCCYNTDNELLDIRDSVGAGTHQRYHYKAQGENVIPYFSYYEADLLPKLHCCQFSTRNCSDFIVYRNATTCSGYSPPSPAQAAGDPHIVTLDGKNYSFNGVGNFYLVKDIQSTFIVQVEAIQAVDQEGELQNATVFSRVAVQMPNASDIVEIRKSDAGAQILVNKQTFSSSTSQFKNISLSTNDDGSYVVVLEPISVSLTVYVTPDLLNIIVLIGEESLRGNLSGLLGNYNGDANDDFISRNGTMLPADSSMRDIHYEFGMTWLVPAEESILATSSDASSVEDRLFNPVFIDELNVSEKAVEVCGDNMQCRFDLTVTEKESLAKATLEISNKFQSLKERLEERVIRCDYLEVPPNGNRTVSGYSNGSIATFTCDPGYDMIQGTPVRFCQSDGSWSGSAVVCALSTVTEGTNVVLMVAVISTGTGVTLLIVIVTSVYCVRKRRRRKPEPIEEIPMSILNIPVFENPAFMQNLQGLVGEGGFRIPRPNFVDPNIYQEYF